MATKKVKATTTATDATVNDAIEDAINDSINDSNPTEETMTTTDATTTDATTDEVIQDAVKDSIKSDVPTIELFPETESLGYETMTQVAKVLGYKDAGIMLSKRQTTDFAKLAKEANGIIMGELQAEKINEGFKAEIQAEIQAVITNTVQSLFDKHGITLTDEVATRSSEMAEKFSERISNTVTKKKGKNGNGNGRGAGNGTKSSPRGVTPYSWNGIKLDHKNWRAMYLDGCNQALESHPDTVLNWKNKSGVNLVIPSDTENMDTKAYVPFGSHKDVDYHIYANLSSKAIESRMKELAGMVDAKFEKVVDADA